MTSYLVVLDTFFLSTPPRVEKTDTSASSGAVFGPDATAAFVSALEPWAAGLTLNLQRTSFFSPDFKWPISIFALKPASSSAPSGSLTSTDEKEGKVRYWYGKEAEEVERMDYLVLIAGVASLIPDKVQMTVRAYGFPVCRQACMPMLIGEKSASQRSRACKLIISEEKML